MYSPMTSHKGLDPHDQDAYDALQRKLVPLWRSIEHLNNDEQSIVVVPSADVDVELVRLGCQMP